MKNKAACWRNKTRGSFFFSEIHSLLRTKRNKDDSIAVITGVKYPLPRVSLLMLWKFQWKHSLWLKLIVSTEQPPPLTYHRLLHTHSICDNERVSLSLADRNSCVCMGGSQSAYICTLSLYLLPQPLKMMTATVIIWNIFQKTVPYCICREQFPTYEVDSSS